MRWTDIQFSPPVWILRQFSGLLLLLFGGLTCWHAWRGDGLTLVTALEGLAALAGIVGLIRPHAVRAVFVAWMVLAFPIGWTISHVVLAFLFYLVFTPIAAIFRVKGRDALALRRARRTTSYWEEKPGPPDSRSYLRQF